MIRKLFQPKLSKNGHVAVAGNYLIELRQLSKVYVTAAGDFPALIDIELKIKPGEFWAITGKSGAGKSTVVNMITGIDRPTSGEIYVGGSPIHTFNEGQIAAWRGRNIGVVFQFFQLIPKLSCLENVMLPMDFCNMYGSQKARKEKALQLLEQMEIADQANKLPSAVSGGQQQRVAIARALANNPPILVADEPTGNLDSKTAAVVCQIFRQLVDQGTTLLMVTHDKELALHADRTIKMIDGRIV